MKIINNGLSCKSDLEIKSPLITQKNWFQTLIVTLADAQEHLENAGKTLPEGFKEFYTRVTNESFQFKERITEADINEADEVLNNTINALEA